MLNKKLKETTTYQNRLQPTSMNSYSSLITEYEFRIRILVSGFLRITMKKAKQFIIDNLKDTNNDAFIRTLKSHHNEYIRKPCNIDNLIKSHMGSSTNILRHFNLHSKNLTSYLDFG
jgi:hypothetical protein